jgi:hypothetical protein
MGNVVKGFVKTVAKAAISGAGSAIPIVGGPLASWINSKFAVGSFDIGSLGISKEDIPEGVKTKAINTPAQLKALVKANPEEAAKAGLSVQMIDKEVSAAKEQAKAVGGMVKIGAPRMSIPESTPFSKPAFATGGKVKIDLNAAAKKMGAAPKGQAKAKSTMSEAAKKELHHQAEVRGYAGEEAKSKMDSKAVGGKVKKPRTPAQIEATRKLVEANRKRRAQK